MFLNPLLLVKPGCDDLGYVTSRFGADVLILPDLGAGDDDVLVEIHYSSVNPVDGAISKYNFLGVKQPQVLGFDYRLAARLFVESDAVSCFAAVSSRLLART